MNFPNNNLGGALRVHPQTTYTDSSRLLHTGLERYQGNGTFSDIVVLTPGGKRLKCHQLVLASCSKKFAGALENGDFAGQELPVQGVDSDALETIIRFFYTAECPITVSTAIPLLDAAIKLDVPGLTAACKQFVNQLLHPVTVIMFIEQSLSLKLDMVTDALASYIATRFDEVINAQSFPTCEYSTFLKIISDNKQRQPESVLFKAVSKWILADNSRMDLAEEVFRLLGISQASVQALVQQQSAVQFLQPNHGLLGNGDGGNMLGGGGLQSMAQGLQGLNTAVQLLPGGGTMSLPASLALQLQQGRPSIAGQMGLSGHGGQDTSASGLLTLMNSQLLGSNTSVDNIRGVLAAAAGQQGMLGLQQGRASGGAFGQDAYQNDVSLLSPGGASRKLAALGQDGGLRHGESGGKGRNGGDGDKPNSSGKGVQKRQRREHDARSRGNDEPPHSPSQAIAAARQALAAGTMTVADFGIDPDQLDSMPTIGNQPPPMKGVCHVDNCNADLTQLRDYHQRFKICDYHLKVSSILKDGVPQRFCQQCGRFHLLTEFDGNKRSCRARLQRHNARRRKRMENEAMGMDADGRDTQETGSQQHGHHDHGDGGLNDGVTMASTLANLSNAGGQSYGNLQVRGLDSYPAARGAGANSLQAQLGTSLGDAGNAGFGVNAAGLNWPGGLASLQGTDVAAALRASGLGNNRQLLSMVQGLGQGTDGASTTELAGLAAGLEARAQGTPLQDELDAVGGFSGQVGGGANGGTDSLQARLANDRHGDAVGDSLEQLHQGLLLQQLQDRQELQAQQRHDGQQDMAPGGLHERQLSDGLQQRPQQGSDGPQDDAELQRQVQQVQQALRQQMQQAMQQQLQQQQQQQQQQQSLEQQLLGGTGQLAQGLTSQMNGEPKTQGLGSDQGPDQDLQEGGHSLQDRSNTIGSQDQLNTGRGDNYGLLAEGVQHGMTGKPDHDHTFGALGLGTGLTGLGGGGEPGTGMHSGPLGAAAAQTRQASPDAQGPAGQLQEVQEQGVTGQGDADDGGMHASRNGPEGGQGGPAELLGGVLGAALRQQDHQAGGLATGMHEGGDGHHAASGGGDGMAADLAEGQLPDL